MSDLCSRVVETVDANSQSMIVKTMIHIQVKAKHEKEYLDADWLPDSRVNITMVTEALYKILSMESPQVRLKKNSQIYST